MMGKIDVYLKNQQNQQYDTNSSKGWVQGGPLGTASSRRLHKKTQSSDKRVYQETFGKGKV